MLHLWNTRYLDRKGSLETEMCLTRHNDMLVNTLCVCVGFSRLRLVPVKSTSPNPNPSSTLEKPTSSRTEASHPFLLLHPSGPQVSHTTFLHLLLLQVRPQHSRVLVFDRYKESQVTFTKDCVQCLIIYGRQTCHDYITHSQV